MQKLYAFPTRIGTFFIAEHNGRYVALFDNENLGSYARPDQAADDLAGGHTDWPSNGTDPSTLDIPADLAEWRRVG